MRLGSWDKLTAFSQGGGGLQPKNYPEKPIPNMKFAVAFGFKKAQKSTKNLGTRTNKLEPVKLVKNSRKKEKKTEKNSTKFEIGCSVSRPGSENENLGNFSSHI